MSKFSARRKIENCVCLVYSIFMFKFNGFIVPDSAF